MEDIQVDSNITPTSSDHRRHRASAPSKPMSILRAPLHFSSYKPKCEDIPPSTPAPPAAIYSNPIFKPLPSASHHAPLQAPPPASPPPQPSTFPPSPSGALPVPPNPHHSHHHRRTPFVPTLPVQIPPSSRDARPPSGRSLASAPHPTFHIQAASTIPIPQSLPNLHPSYPATLFGAISPDDEHVTVWHPLTGKTVAGNAAPYRRNLSAWLNAHPAWEEKADELKSSKRRSAARRQRTVADAFAALCCYPVASFLANDAANRMAALAHSTHTAPQPTITWTNDDFVRLQEAIFSLGQTTHRHACNPALIDSNRWAAVTAQVGGAKLEATVVYCAHHILRKGIAKSQKELVGLAIPASYGSIVSPIHDSSRVGSPASFSSYDVAHHNGLDNFGPSSLPSIKSDVPASFLERSFKAPREPRVTVWNPTDGRTISGNAAPCRRNLETWMRGHPGWVPKEEKQLSSSRRKRNQKVRPSSMPSTQPVLSPSSVEPESPHFNDALQGLLCLSRSPFANSPPNPHPEDCELTDHIDNQCMTPEAGDGHSGANHNAVSVAKKIGLTSSVSSSSAEEGIDSMSDGDVDDEARKMEL